MSWSLLTLLLLLLFLSLLLLLLLLLVVVVIVVVLMLMLMLMLLSNIWIRWHICQFLSITYNHSLFLFFFFSPQNFEAFDLRFCWIQHCSIYTKKKKEKRLLNKVVRKYLVRGYIHIYRYEFLWSYKVDRSIGCI